MTDIYKDITTLNLNKKIIGKLKESNINNIFELCHYSRMELVDKGIINSEINSIMVKLQLIGLNLKSNHATKNTLVDKQ